MSKDGILEILKLDLLISSDKADVLLRELIETSEELISKEGVTVDFESSTDCSLIRMYAAYLYRQRKDPAAPMPRMLRYALNNRVFGEKAGGAEQ